MHAWNENLSPVALEQITVRPTVRPYRLAQLGTPRGRVDAYYYPSTGSRAVLYLAATRTDGFVSPALNLYPRLAEEMQPRHLASLRLRLRKPDDPSECLYDLRVALQFLQNEGFNEVAVVAWGFGCDIALHAAALEPRLNRLCLLSPVVEDTEVLRSVQPKGGYLVVNADRDESVPLEEGKRIFKALAEPKESLTLSHCKHRLNEKSVDVHLRVREWLRAWLRQEPAAA